MPTGVLERLVRLEYADKFYIAVNLHIGIVSRSNVSWLGESVTHARVRVQFMID